MTLKMSLYHDATIMPAVECVYHNNNTFIAGGYDKNHKCIHIMNHFLYNRCGSYAAPYMPPTKTIYQECIYGGIFFSTFGHFILETLQRLYYIKKHPNIPIIWSGNTGNTSQIFQKELFKLLNINNEQIFITEPTLFSKIHIPPQGNMLGGFFTAEQSEALAFYSQKKISNKKIFLSRSKYSQTRGCVNENSIEKILKARGWNVFHPEKHTIERQLFELATAETILATEGSGLHLLVFIQKPQANIFVFPRARLVKDRIPMPQYTYDVIAHMKSQKYFFANLQKNILEVGSWPGDDVFTINEYELCKTLEDTRDFTVHIDTNSKILRSLIPDFDYTIIPDFQKYESPYLDFSHKLYYFTMLSFQKGNFDKFLRQIHLHLKKIPQINDYIINKYINSIDQVKCINNKTKIVLLQKLIKLQPTTSDLHFRLSHCYCIEQNMDDALYHAQIAIDLSPQNVWYKQHLSANLCKIGELDKARAIAEKVLLNKPNLAWPYYQIGCVLQAQNNFQEAVKYTKKAIDLSLTPQKHWECRLQHLIEAMITTNQNNTQETSMQNGISKACNIPFSGSSQRLNTLATHNNAKTYLEIGVRNGETFLNVAVQKKIAVDPVFTFNTEQYKQDEISFYHMTSDAYFENMASQVTKKINTKSVILDLIYIDGLHIFDQTLRDFENTLPYSHEKTIWLLDDTFPSNIYTALPDIDAQKQWKKKAGCSRDNAWYGDVFKVIFAIHDYFENFSYCTYGTQTVIWKVKNHKPRRRRFSSKEEISRLSYEGFVENSDLLNFVSEDEFYLNIFQDVDFVQIQAKHDKLSVLRKIVTDRERELGDECAKYKEQITTLEKKNIEAIKFCEYQKKLVEEKDKIIDAIETEKKKLTEESNAALECTWKELKDKDTKVQHLEKLNCITLEKLQKAEEKIYALSRKSYSDNVLIPPQNIHALVAQELWEDNLRLATILALEKSQCFDENYYNTQYPEHVMTGLSPIEHYVLYGVAQGKNPSPLFDTIAYLAAYPDVADGRINPFWHYLRYGYAERRTNFPVEREQIIATSTTPVQHNE